MIKGGHRACAIFGALSIALSIALLSAAARGEEAGVGHYIPGATSSFIDMLPDRGTSSAVLANAFTYYDGSASPSRELEFGGLLTAGAQSTVYSDTFLFQYQGPWKILGGQPAVQLIVPYVWLEVQGDVGLSVPGRPPIVHDVGPGGEKPALSVHQQDAANGFGDIEMFPLMMGWKYGDLKWQGQFGIYAPSGSFKKGDLANIGRNYWTFEPGGAVSYLSSRFGLEVTAFAGFDFNTMNDATDYQTGDQFHLDGTIAEHLPLFGGFVGAGVNGYFYQQITADSGGGAKLGGFEGMTAGVGPDCSYAYRIGDFDLAGEVKWLPELGVSNRLDGNTVWFKLGVSWGPKPESPVESM